ncbi:recombinase family protein [Saccharothrix sp. NRRL B-16348]|uniref:recombinase family protein n=1 Tax=Saccharothrix sp. NRRL B-16348 TaxID=1415542 RepID=UPI0009E8E6D5|nr:recombinase family protein [Saccharothrix sp. NRRL B-16348]
MENMKRGSDSSTARPRLELLYVRGVGLVGAGVLAGSAGGGAAGVLVRDGREVVKDCGSGLKENRPGLNRVIAMVSDGSVTVVQVTHEDRLARFGIGWLKRLFAVYGVTVEVLYPKKRGGRDELLDDFVSLVTAFAGRLYGMRGADNRRRLLAEAGQCVGESVAA